MGTDVVIVDSPPLSLALHAHANGLLAPFLCESDLILFVVDAQQGMSRSASLARSLSLSRARARARALSLSLSFSSLSLSSLSRTLSHFFSLFLARVLASSRPHERPAVWLREAQRIKCACAAAHA